MSHFPHSLFFLKYVKHGGSNPPQNSGSLVHGTISQKTTIFIGTTVITPDVLKPCGIQQRRQFQLFQKEDTGYWERTRHSNKELELQGEGIKQNRSFA
jgi:hypothetical protein